jgi:hypothetical protein
MHLGELFNQQALNVRIARWSQQLFSTRSTAALARSAGDDQDAPCPRQQLVCNLYWGSRWSRDYWRSPRAPQRTTALTPYRCNAFVAFSSTRQSSVSSLKDTTKAEGAQSLRRRPAHVLSARQPKERIPCRLPRTKELRDGLKMQGQAAVRRLAAKCRV